MNLVDHKDPAYPQESSPMNGLAEACHISLPIWAKQIKTASTQATTATDALTRQFSDLAMNLDNAVAASRPPGDETMTTGDRNGGSSGDSSIQALFERNEAELLRVIELLEEANRTKQELASLVIDTPCRCRFFHG